MGIVGNISLELNHDSERLLEIIKILIDRGFTLEQIPDGFTTNISGKMKIDLNENVQILNFTSD